MRSRKYSKLIGKLYAIPHLRYASISDDMGQRIIGGMKPGVESATAPEEETRLGLQSVVSLKSAEGYQKYTGKLEYLCITWEKMFAVFYLLPNSKSLAVTIDKTGNQPEIINKTTKAVKDFLSKK
jgi:hypothetical protein